MTQKLQYLQYYHRMAPVGLEAITVVLSPHPKTLFVLVTSIHAYSTALLGI